VLHPIAYVSEGYEVVPQNMPADIDDFLKLDQFVTNLAEIQVGTFLPGAPVQTQAKKTASEVNRVAAIENQLREGILMRWSRQFSRGVERMQKGICHPEHVRAASELKTLLDAVRQKEQNAVWARREVVDAFDQSQLDLPSFLVPFEIPAHLDEDAIACCLNMLERNLPPSDILMMAFTSATELLPDTAAQDAQMLDLVVQRYTGNQNINQDELIKLDISKKVGEEIANAIILPKDQVEALAIEATRQQIVELQSITAGQAIPVSPRDNDIVHLQLMTQKLLPIIQQVPPGSLQPEMAGPLSAAMDHYVTHINQAEAKGADKKLIAQYRKAAMEAHNHLTAGHGTPPPPNLVPAAAAPPQQQGGGGGARPPTIAQQQNVGNAAQADNQTQAGQVQAISNPPKPPTAAS
jgi:hypothetical protein